jgi:hypothetical protein
MTARLLANIRAEKLKKIEISDDSLPVVTLKAVCPGGNLVFPCGERVLDPGHTIENLLHFVAHSAEPTKDGPGSAGFEAR